MMASIGKTSASEISNIYIERDRSNILAVKGIKAQTIIIMTLVNAIPVLEMEIGLYL